MGTSFSQVCYTVKAGIILLLAARFARKLESGGEFVGFVVALLGLLLFVGALEHQFLLATPEGLSQYEPLREIMVHAAELLTFFVGYVIAAAVADWIDTTWMNGPFVTEFIFMVVLIIFVLGIVGLRIYHNSRPRTRDIEHLLLISNTAVERRNNSAAFPQRIAVSH
jgi:hypothetical protein